MPCGSKLESFSAIAVEAARRARSRVRRCPSSGRTAGAGRIGGRRSLVDDGRRHGTGSATHIGSPDGSHDVAGGEMSSGRPLAAGALAEHAAQAEEDEHRKRQEDDGVDIHV